jgi:cell wall assembly regulator SMI1
MNTPDRKIIRHLVINEISGVDVPAQAGATAKIMKRAEPVVPPAVTVKPTAEGISAIEKILAIRATNPITKSATQHDGTPSMSNETHFETLIKSRTDKFGETRTEAFKKLAADPQESGLAAAYEADDRAAQARAQAAQSRVDY